MNRTETLALTRYMQALCPAQKFNQYSADAWHDVLGDLPLAVAKKAAASVARRQTFVSPSEIVEATRRLRLAVRVQIERETDSQIDEAPQDARGYIEWRRERVSWAVAEADRRLGDGTYDTTKVRVVGDDDVDPPMLTRTDGRPAIEPPKVIPDAAGQAKVAATLAGIERARKLAFAQNGPDA